MATQKEKLVKAALMANRIKSIAIEYLKLK